MHGLFGPLVLWVKQAGASVEDGSRRSIGARLERPGLRPAGLYVALARIMALRQFAFDADSAQLRFSGEIKQSNYEITILVIEDLPSVIIKQDEAVIYSETVKNIDDMKIFLEERLYTYLAV